MTKITKVQIYRDGHRWCYAAWSGEEYMRNGALASVSSEADALVAATLLFDGASIVSIESLR